MDNPYVIVLLTVAGVLVVEGLLVVLVGRGRAGLAWRAFTGVLGSAATAGRVEAALVPPPPPEPPKPPKPSAEPLRLLALLQREGRLLDFLLEDISAASDEQIGAGVRELHSKAQAALKEHLALAPVLPQEEGAQVEVPPGFDPSAIRLTGNVTGQPPFRGTLLHHGWRVQNYMLRPAPEGQDEFVLQPAEVELP
jgi:hypothetical protein